MPLRLLGSRTRAVKEARRVECKEHNGRTVVFDISLLLPDRNRDAGRLFELPHYAFTQGCVSIAASREQR